MLSAIALALATYSGTLELSDRTETRFRGSILTQNAAPFGFDLVNTPSASLLAKDRRWEYTLSYAPAVALNDLEAGFDPEILNIAAASIGWHERRVRVQLREDAQYGNQNTAYLSAFQATPGTIPAAGVQGIPAITTITFASTRTTFSSDAILSRRWRASFGIGYFLYGGTDSTSQLIIPQQKGPRGDYTLTYALTRNDDLATTFTGSRVDTGETDCPTARDLPAPPPGQGPRCVPQSEYAVVTEGWRHELSRTSEFTIAGGASYLSARLNLDEPHKTRIYPSGSASYVYRLGLEGRHTTFRVDAGVSPVVDMRTGLVDERLQGIVAATTVHRRVTFALTAGLARSFGTLVEYPATFASLGADGEYLVTRTLSVGAGLRYFWQDQAPYGITASEYGSISLTYRPTALKL